MAKAGTIRGLQVFISDIRACQNKEQETRRVDKELAKIRNKFGDDKKTLTAYDRKKYVWKLLYIYMLGYDVEFGHKQACDLIPQAKYSEKQVGYMACSILMNEKDEFLRLAINAIHNDLISRNEAFQSLALTFVANIAGPEMAEALTPDVLKLLTTGTARPVVRKKAALCLLRLMRKTPADAQLVAADSFAPIIAQLLEERDLGLLLSCVTLLLGICARHGSAGYEQCQGKLLRLLERLVYLRDVTPDYTYYGIASPWLQTKVLRALQHYPLPQSAGAQKQLHDTLVAIFNACGESAKSTTVNKSNAQHAILFEAISLILALDAPRDLLPTSVAALGRFLTVKEPNIRYLALENLTRLALVPEVLESIRAHQATILANLRDPDVSIRRRALDLLFTMCDGGAAVEVVEELVTYLTVADFSMREELVLKIAILAEKFAPDVQWYVDVVLALLERAGDFCGSDIWHRVVQLVTNNEGSQAYAAGRVAEVLQRGASHEALVSLAAYVLGQYGSRVQAQFSSQEQFQLLAERLPLVSNATKGLLLSTFLKLLLTDPSNAALKAEVTAVLERYSRQLDPELQQRSAEYLVLAQEPAKAARHYVLPMPKWDMRESALLKRLAATEGNDTDVASAGGAGAVGDEAVGTAPNTGPAAAAAAAAAGGLAAALGGREALAAGVGSPRGAAAPAAAATPATAAAAAAAAPAAAKAPEIDLLGGDDLLLGNGAPAPQPVAPQQLPQQPAPAPQQVPAAAVDPLDELFGAPPAPAPAAAAAPAYGAPLAAAAASGGVPDFLGGAAVAPVQPQQAQLPQQQLQQPAPGSFSHGPPPPQPAAGPTGGSMASYGSMGPPGSQLGPASSGFTSHPSWGTSGLHPAASSGLHPAASSGLHPAASSGLHPAASSGLHPAASSGLHPAASSVSSTSLGYGGFGGLDGLGAPAPQQPPAPIAAGFTGAAFGGVAAAAYAQPQPPQQPQPQPQQPAPAASSGGLGFDDAAFAPADDWRVLGDVTAWHRALLTKDKGILYEDTLLQVGLQSRYTRGSGQLQLFLGNKHASQPLTGVCLAVSVPSQAVQVVVGTLPAQLAPKQQVQVLVQATCLAPFLAPPRLQLRYTAGPRQVVQELALPLACHKFMVPEPGISKEGFFNTWKGYAGPPLKLQQMLERPTPLGVDATLLLLRGLNFGVEHLYLDPSPNNEAGAAYFMAGAPGAEQALLVQARVEGNPQNRMQFRVTVAAPHAQLATSVKDMLVGQIMGVP